MTYNDFDDQKLKKLGAVFGNLDEILKSTDYNTFLRLKLAVYDSEKKKVSSIIFRNLPGLLHY